MRPTCLLHKCTKTVVAGKGHLKMKVSAIFILLRFAVVLL